MGCRPTGSIQDQLSHTLRHSLQYLSLRNSRAQVNHCLFWVGPLESVAPQDHKLSPLVDESKGWPARPTIYSRFAASSFKNAVACYRQPGTWPHVREADFSDKWTTASLDTLPRCLPSLFALLRATRHLPLFAPEHSSPPRSPGEWVNKSALIQLVIMNPATSR